MSIDYTHLKPFLVNKTAQTRIALYLLSKSYDFDNLRKVKVKDVTADKDIPIELHPWLSESIKNKDEDEYMFTHRNGRLCSTNYFKTMLKTTTHKILGRSLDIETFRKYLNKDSMLK